MKKLGRASNLTKEFVVGVGFDGARCILPDSTVLFLKNYNGDDTTCEEIGGTIG